MRVLTVALITCLLALSVRAQYSGGSGTADDPYQIATAADLIALGETPDDYDKHFRLTTDIDLDPNLPGRKVFDRAVIAPDIDPNDKYSFFDGPPFNGVFDGNGHTISHLIISGTSYLGLFGKLGSDGRISDLSLAAVDIYGTNGHVGGFVGQNNGTITACDSAGAANGSRYVGGLVGYNGGSISTSFGVSTVTGNYRVGGLAGFNGGSITASYSAGTVNGSGSVGGLVGDNRGEILMSYSTGAVDGDGQVGGLVGTNDSWANPGIIVNCYSTGVVTGDEEVGGLVGYDDDGTTSRSFWNVETSRQSVSAAGTGLTTTEMQTASTFSGWGTCNNAGTWTIDEGNDYPRLWWEDKPGQAIEVRLIDFLSGEGTQDDPYLIYTAAQLRMVGISSCHWDKHFKLMADIDLSGFVHEGALIAPDTVVVGGFNGTAFTGIFDGNGHAISRLTLQGHNYVGLFGRLASGAELMNLGVADVNVVADGSHVGGLVGSNDGGSIYNCYAIAAVSGNEGVGGLVGSNGWLGRVVRSYSAGTVHGVSGVGGLVGRRYSSVVMHCVWDVEASGLASSEGGIGLTTAEMLDPYVLALKGFANDPNWVQDSGRDYPRLAWEGTVGQTMPELDTSWMEGHGTEEDPYRVDTADQLLRLAQVPAVLDRHFVLGGDLDLDPNVTACRLFDQAVIPEFFGVFDGNHCTISNLAIEGGSYLGLFGRLYGEVKNLGLVNIKVTGTGDYIGGLAGYNWGTITESYNSGTVSGVDNVGGLVGLSEDGFITESYNSGTVSGNSYVGGLVGSNDHGSITRCYSSGTVSGDSQVGGLAGMLNYADVIESYNSGMVSGGSEVGGLAGLSWWGFITESYNSGAVSGGTRVGGLVGWKFCGSITDSYNSGTVSGDDMVGDLVGLDYCGPLPSHGF